MDGAFFKRIKLPGKNFCTLELNEHEGLNSLNHNSVCIELASNSSGKSHHSKNRFNYRPKCHAYSV